MCIQQLDRSEKFSELYKEEKREEGNRGDQEEKSGNQKEREQASH